MSKSCKARIGNLRVYERKKNNGKLTHIGVYIHINARICRMLFYFLGMAVIEGDHCTVWCEGHTQLLCVVILKALAPKPHNETDRMDGMSWSVSGSRKPDGLIKPESPFDQWSDKLGQEVMMGHSFPKKTRGGRGDEPSVFVSIRSRLYQLSYTRPRKDLLTDTFFFCFFH